MGGGVTPNEYEQENNATWSEEKSAIKERRVAALTVGKVNAVFFFFPFPKERKVTQPSVVIPHGTHTHRRAAAPANEPNKPLDGISFLIRPTLSGSAPPRSPSANTGSLYSQPPLHTILLIRDNCVLSSI